MTDAVARTPRSPTVFSPWMIGILAAVILAGIAIGAALLMRGPDTSFAPVMAEHPVVFTDGSQLYVQKYEVTVAEWNICHAAEGCDLELRVSVGKSPDTMSATGLNYVDASQYVAWINGQSRSHTFRLPTLQEWEYMAAEVLPPEPDPIFTDPDLTWASTYLMEPQTARALRPQGTFETTSHGIVDLNGSVWEWTQDCYAGVATDVQITPDRCPAFFVGGEHVAAMSYLERDPARGGCAVGAPPAHLGMRLVSDKPF